MNREFQDHISKLLKEQVLSFIPVSGGDISRAYKIDTSKTSYFLKVNQSSNALRMFQAEVIGLQSIKKTQTIATPEVLIYDTFDGYYFLIMEYIESKSASSNDFNKLGQKLAELHQNTSESFGLENDNFIGSLYQCNKPKNSWVDFYVQERLQPQLQLARQKGFLSTGECPSVDIMKENLNELFLDVKPSLLHGDLWNGNYLISKNGIPYLIDPAIYYGHSEVDIAMSKLFGGFGNDFYKAYHSVHPRDSNTDSRIDNYQLYYLLVHLNLFGRSYYGSVHSILKKYF